MLILVPTHIVYVSSRHYTRTEIAPAASLDRNGKPEGMSGDLRVNVARIILEKMSGMCVGDSAFPLYQR